MPVEAIGIALAGEVRGGDVAEPLGAAPGSLLVVAHADAERGEVRVEHADADAHGACEQGVGPRQHAALVRRPGRTEARAVEGAALVADGASLEQVLHVRVDMPAGGVERDRAELLRDRPRDLGRGERDDQVGGQVALRVDDRSEAQTGQAGDRRLHDPLVGAEVGSDQVELSHLRQQHRAGQLGHPEVHAQERALGVLGPEPVRRVTLIVDGEEPSVQVLVIGDDHAAVATGDGLVLVEAVDPGGADPADALTLVCRPEGLRAVFDQRDAVPVRDVLDLIEPGGRAEHVDGDDRLGPRGDPRLDVGRVEVERIVDLGQDRRRPGVDDRRDRGDERETGNDDLIARPDSQAQQRQPEPAGAAAAQAKRVLDPGERRDLLLDVTDLGAERRVVGAAIPAEVAAGEDLHHLGDLFLADELDTGSGHASSPFVRATDCTAPYQHDILTVNIPGDDTIGGSGTRERSP